MNISNLFLNPNGYRSNINTLSTSYSRYQPSFNQSSNFSQNSLSSISSLLSGLIGQLSGGASFGNSFGSNGLSGFGNSFGSNGLSGFGNSFGSNSLSGFGNSFGSNGLSGFGNSFGSNGLSGFGNNFGSGGFSGLGNGYGYGYMGGYGQLYQSVIPTQFYQPQPVSYYPVEPEPYYPPQQDYEQPRPAPQPVQPPRGISISHDVHTGALDDGKFVKLRGWHDNNQRVQLWKHVGNTGDIDLIGVHTLPDGTIVATSGNEEIHNVSGRARPLVDANGDGYVFKLSPKGSDGRFRFEVDRGHGGGVLRGYLN